MLIHTMGRRLISTYDLAGNLAVADGRRRPVLIACLVSDRIVSDKDSSTTTRDIVSAPIIAHIVTIALWRRISGSASDISAASSLVSLRKPPPGG